MNNNLSVMQRTLSPKRKLDLNSGEEIKSDAMLSSTVIIEKQLFETEPDGPEEPNEPRIVNLSLTEEGNCTDRAEEDQDMFNLE